MQAASQRETFEAIGTLWKVDLPGANEAQWADIMPAIRQRIDEFDQTYSRFREDSLVTQMAGAAGTYRLPPDAAPMMELYRRFYKLTDGAMTPLIGELMADAGYDASYSLREREAGLRATAPWGEMMSYADGMLTLLRPALLDFGAVGKGYAVDLVSELIEAAGIWGYCVDAGGDIRRRGAPGEPARIGLEHPAQPGTAIGVAQLGDLSLCGSAGNRRAWGRWHHIINPLTQSSPQELAAVWAVAGTTRLADGLTTALYFADPARLRAEFEFEYAILYSDGRLEHSRNFPADFFTEDSL